MYRNQERAFACESLDTICIEKQIELSMQSTHMIGIRCCSELLATSDIKITRINILNVSTSVKPHS